MDSRSIHLIAKIQKLLLSLKIKILEIVVQPGWKLDGDVLGEDNLGAELRQLDADLKILTRPVLNRFQDWGQNCSNLIQYFKKQ